MARMLNPTSPYAPCSDDEDAVTGSVGGDGGIGSGGIGSGGATSAVEATMQEAVGEWNASHEDEGVMLVCATQHGPGFVNFNRKCRTEGEKDTAAAGVAQGQARKRKPPGEKCKCTICKAKYQFRFVIDQVVADSKFNGKRLVNSALYRTKVKSS